MNKPPWSHAPGDAAAAQVGCGCVALLFFAAALVVAFSALGYNPW